MSRLNVAIVGSNGFIGKHLANRLMAEDCDLFLFGRNETSNLPGKFNYRKIDLRDDRQVKENFETIDLIYYLASETIPANSWDNPLADVEKNLVPFLSFAQSVSTLNIKKIVYLSSAGTIYGSTNEVVNENSVTNPFSPYGIVKLAIEKFLLYYKTRGQFNYDIFRISNVYGPDQNIAKGLGLINTLLEKVITEKRVTIFGSGDHVRNFIYVKDAVEILASAVKNDLDVSGVYNLCSDDVLSINEIVALIKKIVPGNFDVVREKSRQSDNPATRLDNSKLKAAYPGFTFTPIIKGITDTYHHILDKHRG